MEGCTDYSSCHDALGWCLCRTFASIALSARSGFCYLGGGCPVYAMVVPIMVVIVVSWWIECLACASHSWFGCQDSDSQEQVRGSTNSERPESSPLLIGKSKYIFIDTRLIVFLRHRIFCSPSLTDEQSFTLSLDAVTQLHPFRVQTMSAMGKSRSSLSRYKLLWTYLRATEY